MIMVGMWRMQGVLCLCWMAPEMKMIKIQNFNLFN